MVEYIGYYNTKRRHSSLRNIALAEFERRWRAGIKPKDKRGPVHFLNHSIQLGRDGLIEAKLLFQAQYPNRLKQAQRA